jgi:AraC-like DNA-binding protein
MDALSGVLEFIKLKSAVYFKSDFSAPWGMEISKGPYAQFHMVVKGKCLLNMHDQKIIELNAGDIVIFPFGGSHWLADAKESQKEDGLKVVESIWNNNPLFKGDNFSTTLICGHFEFDKTIEHSFIKSLPGFIHINDIERKEFSWLETISNLIMKESGTDLIGNTITINRLAEVLFIHSIRAFILKNNDKVGFFAALKNSKLNNVLKLIHNNPEKNWTLKNLSTEAGMSRTLFANKFRDTMGETPLHYITNWRILKAKQFLTESHDPIVDVAARVGYSSEAAFNRVFKKKVLKTPAAYRRATS